MRPPAAPRSAFPRPVLAQRTGLAALALAALALGTALAQDPVGEDEYYIRTIAKIGDTRLPSARSRAMGSAWAALSNDGASVQENPAAVGAMDGRGFEGMLGFNQVDNGDDRKSETLYRVGGALSVAGASGASQTVGMAFSRRSQDEAYTTGGLEQNAFTVAYGSSCGPDLLWGLALSGYNGEHSYHWTTDDRDRTAWSGGELAAGVLYRMGDDFTLGATGGYGGGSARSHRADSAGLRTHQSGTLNRYFLRGGLAWQLAPATLLAGDLGWSQNRMRFKARSGLDARDTSVSEWDLGLGIEHALLPERLVARAGAGYHYTSYSPGGAAAGQRAPYGMNTHCLSFTAGLGARLGPAMDLGYTLDLRTNGDVGNYLSAQIGF